MPDEQELILRGSMTGDVRLIDLTYRNRLIRYRPTKASTLEIAAPALRELLFEDPDRTTPWRFSSLPRRRKKRQKVQRATPPLSWTRSW